MAEMDTYHTQKAEDFATLAKEHLDGEIEFYEQVSPKVSHDTIHPRLGDPSSGSFIVSILKRERKLKTHNAGPPPSAHSASHVRVAGIPASGVRWYTQAVHLRAGPRASALEPGSTPTALPARVGRDADAAREPRDPGGRRAFTRHRRQCRFRSGQRIWAVLVRGVRGCSAA
jgi:hypothetical protein